MSADPFFCRELLQSAVEIIYSGLTPLRNTNIIQFVAIKISSSPANYERRTYATNVWQTNFSLLNNRKANNNKEIYAANNNDNKRSNKIK